MLILGFTEYSNLKTKDMLVKKKTARILWELTMFCWTKTSELPTKSLFFFKIESVLFLWVSVPNRCVYVSASLTPKFEGETTKATFLTKPLTFVLFCVDVKEKKTLNNYRTILLKKQQSLLGQNPTKVHVGFSTTKKNKE